MLSLSAQSGLNWMTKRVPPQRSRAPSEHESLEAEKLPRRATLENGPSGSGGRHEGCSRRSRAANATPKGYPQGGPRARDALTPDDIDPFPLSRASRPRRQSEVSPLVQKNPGWANRLALGARSLRPVEP